MTLAQIASMPISAAQELPKPLRVVGIVIGATVTALGATVVFVVQFVCACVARVVQR